jgi:hypothetical protein
MCSSWIACVQAGSQKWLAFCVTAICDLSRLGKAKHANCPSLVLCKAKPSRTTNFCRPKLQLAITVSTLDIPSRAGHTSALDLITSSNICPFDLDWPLSILPCCPLARFLLSSCSRDPTPFRSEARQRLVLNPTLSSTSWLIFLHRCPF